MEFSHFADIHTHILPGVDDGAGDEFDALNMIKMAYDDGTRNIILTPHFHGGRMQTGYDMVERSYGELKELLGDMYPDLMIYPGNEIFYFDSCAEWLDDKKLHTLAGTRYVLVEFPEAVSERDLTDALKHLLIADYYPVLAHIERYEVFRAKLDTVYRLIDIGAYMQVNANALLGGMGFKIKRFAGRLLKNDAVHFIASDAHSTGRRSPKLSECHEYVRRKYGIETAERIFYKNQMKLIENKVI